MTKRRPTIGPFAPSGLTEVLFEFQRQGNIMRVVAIDPVSGAEVTMIADPRHGEHTIKNLAIKKLEYVMRKKAEKKALDENNKGPGPRSRWPKHF